MMQNSLATDSDFTMAFGEESRFVPEAGQTVATATQATIENDWAFAVIWESVWWHA